MRQIVSLIKDNQAHYALVDDENGTIIPFAELLIPDPERFGLHESALLGTNLVNVLGLNGTKRPKSRPLRVGEIQPSNSPQLALDVDAPALAPPAPPQAPVKRGRPPGSRNKAQRFIPLSEMVAVINEHPEGMTAREIAVAIAGNDSPPEWLRRAIDNRVAQAEAGPARTPFRVDRSQKGPTGPKRVVYPL